MAKVKLLDPSDTKRRLDRYELIGELATGGMATVYLARLAGVGGFQRFVAIKRLHPHLASEEEFIEMFLDEARLAAGIHHPHVVPIIEVGQSDSGYYLVMEYIEGDTLARIVARALSNGKPVPRAILLRILLDSLAGLHAAHELTDDSGKLVQLVHRDCSPQNILVGVDGSSRITDFGVARASSRLSTTRSHQLKGKLAYMSPEQAQGDLDLDRRSDLFGMGVILWEVLAGRRLFKADTEAGTMRRVMVDPIARLSAVMPTIPAPIDDVCARALERDLERRFQTAAEMADALEGAGRASASANDAGVASPREVAAYVQGVLGQDIAAQRESVRAWLSQSESSMPMVALAYRSSHEANAKAPPDDLSWSSVMPPPPGVTSVTPYASSQPLPLVPQAPGAPAAPGRGPPAQPSPGAPQGGVELRAIPPSPPLPGPGKAAALKLSTKTLMGVGGNAVAGVGAQAPPPAPPPPGPMEPEDENETLLMVRDGMPGLMKMGAMQATAAMPPRGPMPSSEGAPESAPRSAPWGARAPMETHPRSGFPDQTPLSSIPFASQARPGRLGPKLAVVAGVLLVVLGGLLAWRKLRPSAPEPIEGVPSPAPTAMATSSASEPPAPPPPPPSDATAQPSATALPSEPPAVAPTVVAPSAEVGSPPPPKSAEPSAPPKGPAPVARPPAPPAPKPPTSASPAPGNEDLTNPYR
jgi:serine/threonine protein kinase